MQHCDLGIKIILVLHKRQLSLKEIKELPQLLHEEAGIQLKTPVISKPLEITAIFSLSHSTKTLPGWKSRIFQLKGYMGGPSKISWENAM